MRVLPVALIGALAIVLGGCAGEAGSPTDGFTLPSDQAESYQTAYLASVVPGPEGDDLAEGGGEYVIIENNADIRVDMGGWVIVDTEGNRLPLGIGRQIDVGAELRVYSSCGESSEQAVFACGGAEVLDDDGDTLQLLDSAGGEVAEFAYGDAAE